MTVAMKIITALIGVGGFTLGAVVLSPTTPAPAATTTMWFGQVEFYKGQETIVCPSLEDAAIIMNWSENEIRQAILTGAQLDGYDVRLK